MQEENNFENEETGTAQIEEVGFADRTVGIFTNPVKTLDSIAKMPQKISLWQIPIVIMVLVASLSTVLYNYNTTLRAELERVQLQALEKNMNEQVQKGSISREDADKQIATMTEQINSFGSMKLVFQIVSIIFVTFIYFFIVNGFFFAIIKFGFGGEGNYSAALIAYSSAYYIMILQALLTMILSLASSKFFVGLSLGNFFDFEMLSLNGFVFRKLDPFLIWFYVVLGISYAKMFKSENYTKYIVLTVLSWVLVNSLLYYLTTISSFFQGFTM